MICAVLMTAAFQMLNARTMKVMGTITNTEGKPLQGVVVSDGYSAVQTNASGQYEFIRNEGAYYVHYSIPEDCDVPIRNGIPCFFKKLDRDSVYNFVLAPKKTGADKSFSLFFLADPQCQNIRHLRRFHSETVADMKAYAKKTKTPNYGITLGDISYTEGEFNTSYLLPLMKEEMEMEKTGMPVFQTNGNHDHIYEGLALNEQNPTPMVRYKRMFEDIFGPINYSWNRGEAHIISMDNVMYDVLNTGARYHGELTGEQIEWLKKDLSYVPKNKLIIFCAHIPVYHMRYQEELLDILGEFKNCVIFTGHIHTNTFHVHKNGIKEYNLAAASGCWWWSRCNGDGTPNGYKVVTISGNKISNQVWKSSCFPATFQMRLYRGNACFGGKYEKFQLPWDEGTILANVFAWEEGWKVQAYEDGKLMGELKRMPLTGKSDQFPNVKSSKDWWAIGYNCGVIGRGQKIFNSNRNSYINTCAHMFMYKMQNPKAKLKIVVIDNYGNTYSQSDIISGNALTDFEGVYKDDIAPIYPNDPSWN